MTVQIEKYIEVLQLLADRYAQLNYERNVPIADVPTELVCMWFDDLPSPTTIAGISAGQRATLEAFSQFFEERTSALPQTGGVRALHATPAWGEIVERAQEALRAVQ